MNIAMIEHIKKTLSITSRIYDVANGIAVTCGTFRFHYKSDFQCTYNYCYVLFYNNKKIQNV